MTARRAATAAVVVAALAAAAVPAGAPAAQAACSQARAPTRALAWRAYIPAATPVRTRAAAHTTVLSGAPSWRLVTGVTRGPGGACLLDVRLARRPNGAHAWVAASRVTTLRATRWRVEVDRAHRRATLLHAGRAVARWPVVVGKPSTPTPAGLFAVQASYRTPPSSFEGRWILALTAHSDVLATFDGGDGTVALHGRGGASLADPLGTAASHGCIRFDDRAIGTIVRRVGRARLPGVPVAIR
ncbi:L,D-transpeptidase [Conexibacter woesei]|uniref:L,D-transpeptidase n=1 Tax=Conexibacter woesei TaxID=191495 RepID=UPI0004284813|nr:L,D-transpeptidase [Conexibacter woesei]